MIIITGLYQGKEHTPEFEVSSNTAEAVRAFWECCGTFPFNRAILVDDVCADITDNVLEAIFESAAERDTLLDALEAMLAPRHHKALDRFRSNLEYEMADYDTYGTVESQARADYGWGR